MSDLQKICGNPNCSSCRHNYVFAMPEEIPVALAEGRLALFAGAGISTEGIGIFPATFYDEIARDLDVSPEEDVSFPALMSRFCARRDRRELLGRIKHRFDYLRSFPEVYRDASRFHQALSSVPFMDQIFTTNWDELFESECVATPIVTGEDFAFWNIPGRKVFKLHGSVSHYSSIVATEEDYERCLETLRSGLIGSSLKLALATKTIVFAGYSVRDSDFLQILRLVREEVGATATPMYAVTLCESDRTRLEKLGLRVIVTDATYFVDELKRVLVAQGLMLNDSWRDDAYEILGEVVEAHGRISDKFNCVDYPALVYTFFYQDGLRHGLELLLARSKAGEYSHRCHVRAKVKIYEAIRAERMRERRYGEVAYIDGYCNALVLPLADKEDRFCMPLYYLFGFKEEISGFDGLASILPGSRSIHKAAYKHAEGIVRRLGSDPEIICGHTPFLD